MVGLFDHVIGKLSSEIRTNYAEKPTGSFHAKQGQGMNIAKLQFELTFRVKNLNKGKT